MEVCGKPSSGWRRWITLLGGIFGGDCYGAPLLVWVKLAPSPFWLEPAVVVDMLLAGWCSWTLGMSPKVGCSEPSIMVERI
jgi:hypothetical protein